MVVKAVWSIVACALAANAASNSSESVLLAHADDYVFGYYPCGWRDRDSNGDIVFAVQSPRYALLVNASRARVEKAGSIGSSLEAEAAAQETNDNVLAPLRESPLTFHVRIGDIVYDAVAGAPNPDAVLIQRLGKYLVNLEVRAISLQSPDGTALQGVKAKMLLYGWADHARVIFQIDADSALTDVSVVAHYVAGEGHTALRGVNLIPEQQSDRSVGRELFVERKHASLNPGASATVCIGLYPRATANPAHSEIVLRAKGVSPYSGDLVVQRDPHTGWHQILLGENPDIWTMERVRLDVENPGGNPRTVHLSFAKRGGGFGITGMSPVLCDDTGAPLGLPIQISKNWHISPPWFDGITMIDLAPHAKHTLEFRLAYAQWGGVPAVSHAQLALEGWGTHQLWDECAIGSFGESITYDPDVNLGRAMIDDVRPLMVWGMGKEPRRKWSWTHNVGGGDFLVLERNGKRQYLGRQKTEYESQGPVLTTVRYSGETPDGAIQSHVTTQSWRSDDFVRGLYTVRYEVVKPVEFSRLAFFQLGADRYNGNLFTSILRGDIDGMKETWTPPMGGTKYSRERMPVGGDKPWFAITGNTKNPPPAIAENDQGAWADRGLIVHRWSARLGGAEVPLPHYSVYGTEDGKIPSAVIELSPPPGLARLEPGDFVDAQVEMVILPQRAEDYYGPNGPFRDALRDHGGDWQMIHREAAGTALRVRADAGTVVSEWPVVVRAHRGSKAVFTIEGGRGYVPITIAGAKRRGPFKFEMTYGGQTYRIEHSTANDCWQTRYHSDTKTYDLIFIVSLDSDEKDSRPRMLIWSQETSLANRPPVFAF